MKPSRSGPPKIPFRGFALVFGLVNGALWFLIAGAVLSGVTAGLAATGGLTSGATLACLATVSFFACFFGLPGALGGYLGQAGAGRIALPPVDQWGPGALARIHRLAFFHGALSTLVVAGIAWWYLGAHRPPARGDFVLLVAGVAALVATVNSALLAGKRALGDLKPRGAPPPPTRSYYWRRFALPQGAGNGLITALVALGTAPRPGTPPLDARALVLDAVATALVIGMFMLTTGGALATVDRQYQLVAGIAGPPPSWTRRLQLLVGVVAVAAVIAVVMGKVAGAAGVPLGLFVAWKGLLGAATAGALALVAARATLARSKP